jgi:Protein of unknown function (DUF1345)
MPGFFSWKSFADGRLAGTTVGRANPGTYLLVHQSERMTMSADTDTTAPTPRLVSDFDRLTFSVVIGAACTVLAGGVYLAVSSKGLSGDVAIVAVYIFSSLSSLAYFVTTFAVFQDADSATLARWLSGTAATGRLSKVQATFAGTGPNIPAQWSVLAIGSVAVLVFSPHLLKDPWVIALSAFVVATAWLVTMASYAVHYARVVATVGGLTFPSDEGVVFWDCVYLATQVQTTFSSSDVTVETTLTRRIVTGHTLIAFAFNTVIIALLIAVLFLGRG